MIVLHVAFIEDNPQSGVANVVPQHAISQSKHATVGVLNLNPFVPGELMQMKNNTFILSEFKNGISDLPHPFNNPSIVIFHEIYRPDFIKLSAYCKASGIPYAIMPHGSLTQTALKRKWLKKFIANKLIVNSFIKNAHAIHYLSKQEMESSSKAHPKGLASFISHNGVRPSRKVKSNFNTDKLRLVYIGRLSYIIKGIDRILQACAVGREKMRELDIEVELFGSGEKKDVARIQKMITDSDIGDIVKISGPRYGSEKIKEILNNDVFIQLSRSEGQPLGLIEAMSLGMPCIVTRGTTFEGVAKTHGAAIFVSDSPSDIASSIIDIRKDTSGLYKISENARIYTERTHAWEKVSREALSHYQHILDAQDGSNG